MGRQGKIMSFRAEKRMWKRKHKGEGASWVGAGAQGGAGKRGRKQSKDTELQMILMLIVRKMEGSLCG